MFGRFILNHARKAAALSGSALWFSSRHVASVTAACEAADEDKDAADKQSEKDESSFLGQCPQRQLFIPKLPYPAWDYDWDGRMTESTSLKSLSTKKGLLKSKQGKTRHILLIRHGQYDESSKDDEKRRLTLLGKKQAELTGLRLSTLAQRGPCHFKAIHVSDMTRAKETAAIIASHLPGVDCMDPDPLLNEALPSPMIPARPDVPNAEKEIDANHDRIETAFQKYFYRSSSPRDNQDDDGEKEEPKHEFAIIVGHGNVIRYFLCR